MKLSIIVPIYNVEKYLCKCVDSLLCQDLSPEDYEIILVDDGSPDLCGTIADKYALTYSNVHVIHQVNSGLSVARNTGLLASKGAFIQFVDSDDYLEPNVLGTIVRKMDKEQLDVLRFNYQNVNEEYTVFEPYKDVKPFVDYRDDICEGRTFLSQRLGYACYVVQFIIRKGMLVHNDIFFKPNIFFEDTEWTPRMLSFASRVTSTELIVYNYLLRAGSITTGISIDRKRKLLHDKINLIQSLQTQKNSSYDTDWYDGMISITAVSVLTLLSVDFYKERKTYLLKLHDMNVFPLHTCKIPRLVIRKAKLANLSPLVFCVVYHYKNIL